MPRIRSIKPEFPHSESMGRISRDARLTFIELWTIADDAGRLRGNGRMLASLLFPYDDDAPAFIDKWLAELESEDCIIRYKVNGTSYIQICKFNQHQKIDHPQPSKLPSPPESFAKIREDSRTFAKTSETLATDLDWIGLDQGVDQGKEKEPPLPPKGGDGSVSELPKAKPTEGKEKPSPAFEEFWQAWPRHERKVGKSKCWKRWHKAGWDKIADDILAALDQSIISPSWQKNAGEFIPQPITWLNQTPWETEPQDRVSIRAPPSDEWKPYHPTHLEALELERDIGMIDEATYQKLKAKANGFCTV